MRDISRQMEREMGRDEREEYRERRESEFRERDERCEERIRESQDRGERLRIQDITDALPGISRVVRRQVRGGEGFRGQGFEWVTHTENYAMVGCTYMLRSGRLSIVAFEPRNAQLFDGIVRTHDQLRGALEQAERTHGRLTHVPEHIKPKNKYGNAVYVRCKPGLGYNNLRVILRDCGIRYSALGPAPGGADNFSLKVTKPSVERALALLNGQRNIILASREHP